MHTPLSPLSPPLFCFPIFKSVAKKLFLGKKILGGGGGICPSPPPSYAYADILKICESCFFFQAPSCQSSPLCVLPLVWDTKFHNRTICNFICDNAYVRRQMGVNKKTLQVFLELNMVLISAVINNGRWNFLLCISFHSRIAFISFISIPSCLIYCLWMSSVVPLVLICFWPVYSAVQVHSLQALPCRAPALFQRPLTV